jgi:hypothetical protein
MKYFRVKDLVEELLKHDQELPVVITDDGRDHQYGVIISMIYNRNHPYFGNDDGAEKAFKKDDRFLNIGTI